MKSIKKEDLIIRDSMILSFSRSDIWCIELDSLNVYTDVVIGKFLKDMETTRRPSSPGLIAIHLYDTIVQIDLVSIIVTELKKAGNAVHKVVFIGLNRSSKRLMKATIKEEGVYFAYDFINDYEKAKEWLVS